MLSSTCTLKKKDLYEYKLEETQDNKKVKVLKTGTYIECFEAFKLKGK